MIPRTCEERKPHKLEGEGGFSAVKELISESGHSRGQKRKMA